MTRKRKTIAVAEVLERANTYLRTSPDAEVQMRAGVASLLEQVLMDTGNYNGFGYIGGYEAGVTDESRRQYYRS